MFSKMLISRMDNNIKILVFCCISSLIINKSFGADESDIKRLRTDLLAGYDRNARPSIIHQNSTLVTFNIYYRTFEVDEHRSTFTFHAWTVLSWTDEHLRWDKKAYGNLTKIHFTSEEVWTPDLSLYNNFDQSYTYHFGVTNLISYSTGRIVWVPPTNFEVACSYNLRQWPYDTQVCYILIGSWAHDGGQLDLTIPVNQTTILYGEIVENREWDLISNKMESRRYTYAGISYPDILITLTIRRKSASHTAAIIVPGLTISIGLLISFWLRPISNERIAMILLMILMNGMYLDNLYRRIPNNGSDVPLVVLYFRDSLLLLSVALIWTIVLRSLSTTKRTSPVPLPNIVTTLLNSWVSKILCLEPRPTTTSAGTNQQQTSNSLDDNDKLITQQYITEDWAWLAHLLDRVMFVIYFIVFIVFYCALL